MPSTRCGSGRITTSSFGDGSSSSSTEWPRARASGTSWSSPIRRLPVSIRLIVEALMPLRRARSSSVHPRPVRRSRSRVLVCSSTPAPSCRIGKMLCRFGAASPAFRRSEPADRSSPRAPCGRLHTDERGSRHDRTRLVGGRTRRRQPRRAARRCSPATRPSSPPVSTVVCSSAPPGCAPRSAPGRSG